MTHADYTILDQNGRMVCQGTLTGKELSLTGLPVGVYYLRLATLQGQDWVQILEKMCP